MNLPFAQRCAERLVAWLAPSCVRIEVAGSVRRRKADPADLDLVVIPKVIQEQDMFGTTVTFVAGGIQVDVFWASEAPWGTTLLQRTGSKEHNIWL